MKVVNIDYLRKSKRLKKVLVSTVVFYCCLVGCGSSAYAVDIYEVYTNKQSTKYKVTLSDDIYKITDTNGLQIIPEQLSGKSVLFSAEGKNKVRVYVNRDEYIVVDLHGANVVKDNNPPNVLWKYKNSDQGMICLKVEDEAGVYQINSVGDFESARVILTKMPKSAEVSLNTRESDKGIDIYDVFGNYKLLHIENITLDVIKAIRNANGDSILLKLNDSYSKIQNITHTDGQEIVSVSKSRVDDTYDTASGTTQIIVNYDNKSILVPLDTDVSAPKIIRAYRSTNNGKIFLEAKDIQSGIRKISVCNRDENVEDVIKQFVGVNEMQLLSRDIPVGSTHVRVYDGVHNKVELDLNDVVVDDKSPLVTMDYNDGRYSLNVKKDKSGVGIVSLDNVDIGVYENYPVGEFTYDFEDLDGDSVIRASDGVGNTTLLTVNETLRTVRRVYKNEAGSRLSIDIEDKRGIQEITDQDNHPIERFLVNTGHVKGFYKVRPNTSQVKVFYQDGKSYLLDLEELVDGVVVTDKVLKGDLVSKCKVSSKAGIKEVRYKDGRKISFKQDLPDDITITCTVADKRGVEVPTFVTVYDAVGNSININETLE